MRDSEKRKGRIGAITACCFMIDIHAHPIPMVDDGPQSIEESIALIKYAIDNGTSQMIATPHYHVPIYVNSAVQLQYESLLRRIEAEGLDIKLHLGNELYLSEEGVEALFSGYVHTMAGSKYVLVELPEYHYYPFHEELIFRIQHKGYRVILAHVERYHIFEKDPRKLEQLIHNGVVVQLSSSYIVSRATRKKAYELIKQNKVHIIAADGHDLEQRRPGLREAHGIIKKAFGGDAADKLFHSIPSCIINNAEIYSPGI